MAAFVAFPHVGHLRHLEAFLKKHGDDMPPLPRKLRYRGTAKLHGTNAAVVETSAGAELLTQSRNRFVSVGDDNFGFAAFVDQRSSAFSKLFAAVRSGAGLAAETSCRFYGEFAGQGVQKQVAISSVPRFFTIFAVYVGTAADAHFLDLKDFSGLHDNAERIFDVFQFGEWTLEVDLQDVSASLSEVKAATAAVGGRCPAGKFFGVEGPGEGLVWQCLDLNESALWFKSKTEEFQVSPDELPRGEGLSAAEKARAFASVVMTPARLRQAEDFARENGKVGKAAIGAIVSWATADALREEGQFLEEGEERKAYKIALDVAARKWAVERDEV